MATFLVRVSRPRPHLVVLDDLHWADEPSLQLLRFLAAGLRDSRLLVVGTYRDLEVGSGHPLGRLLGEVPGGARLVRVDGLSRAEVGELMSALADGRQAEEELVRSVHDRTAGNPFFVHEVLRLRARGAERAGDVPSGARAVVGRRLGQLSVPCRDALAAASILGSEFGLPLLADVAGQPGHSLAELAEEAAAARILEEAAPGHYRFSHALVREVLAGHLPARRRHELHRRAAAALEARQDSHVESIAAELACHLRKAGGPADLERALDYEERAGRWSLGLRAPGDGAEHLGRALELLELVDPGARTRRCELLLALGEARLAAGQAAAGRRTLEQAFAAARELRAPRLQARAALAMGAELPAGGTDDLQVGMLEEALGALGDEDPALRARMQARLAQALAFSPLHERRAALAGEAMRTARGLDDAALLAAVLASCHQALAVSEPAEARLRLAEEAIALAEASGDRATAADGRDLRLGDLVELGRIDEVREELALHSGAHAALGRVSSLWHVPLYRAHLAALGGRFDEAERLGAEALTLGRRVQQHAIEVLHATVTSTVAFLRGRMAGQVDALRREVRAHPASTSLRAALTLALWDAGHEGEARAEFERMAAAGFRDVPRDLVWLACLALLAVTCADLGDAGRAASLYELMLPRGAYNVPLPRIGGTMGSCEHYLGLLAAVGGRWDQAVAHLEAAVASHDRQGFPPLVVSSRFRLACALARRGAPGDAARAAAELDAARSLAAALDVRLPAGDQVPVRPAAGEATSLRLEGEIWTLTHRGRESRLRDGVGMGLLLRLLREPGREFHVLDLASARDRGAPPASDTGPVLDAQARSQYRRRLQELAEEIEEAEAWGDPERGARARREADLLTEELVRAVGLGGRDRRPGSDAERARVSVTKALRGAIRRIAGHEPELGAHLGVGVRTGTYCAYAPDPASAVRWTL